MLGVKVVRKTVEGYISVSAPPPWTQFYRVGEEVRSRAWRPFFFFDTLESAIKAFPLDVFRTPVFLICDLVDAVPLPTTMQVPWDLESFDTFWEGGLTPGYRVPEGTYVAEQAKVLRVISDEAVMAAERALLWAKLSKPEV